MKKLLSIFLAFLCLLPTCSVKGYQTANLPDGGKKITLKYNDLETISNDYNIAINKKIEFRKNICGKVNSVLLFFNLGFAIAGSMLCHSSIQDKQEHKQNWWKKLLAGVGLIILGIPLFIGGKKICEKISSHSPEEYIALSDSAVFKFDKEYIDASIEKGNLTEKDKENIYIDLFIDNKGYVYKHELHGSNGVTNEASLCNKDHKYKFPLSL